MKAQKSKSINIMNSSKFKEALLKIISPGIKEEYEIYIQDLVKSIQKRQIFNTSKKNKNKKEEEQQFNIDLDLVQYILSKRKRTPEDLFIIKCFLSQMNFISLNKIKVGKDKLLFSLSKYLKLEKKPKNSILFRYGNKGNKFYIVLSGELSVLILKDTKVHISYLRYFMHLLILKLLKEDDLLYNIISNNFGPNYVSKNEFENYYEEINKLVSKYFGKCNNKNRYFIFPEKYEEIKRSSTFSLNTYNQEDVFKNIELVLDSEISSEEEDDDDDDDEDEIKKKEIKKIKKYNLKNIENEREKKIKRAKRKEIFEKNPIFFKIYNINKNINYSEIPITRMETKHVKLIIIFFIFCKEIIFSKKQFLSVNDYINFTYLNSPMHKSINCEENYEDKEEFNLFQYFEITKKKKGDTFGELALQHDDNRRTGTIMTLSDSVLGYLSRVDYDLSLSDIELKKRKNDVNFIMSFSIFSQMNWFVFENKYFNYFKKETFVQGEKILVQNQKNSKLYFIMEGQFEITTSISLKRLYSFLKLKMGDNFDITKKTTNDKTYNIRLYISNNKDLLGLEDCCYYDDISFIDATCISLRSTVLTLEMTILKELRQKIPEIEYDIKKLIDKKESIMIERLKKIYYKYLESYKYLKKERNISSSIGTNKLKLKLDSNEDELNNVNQNDNFRRDKKRKLTDKKNIKDFISPLSSKMNSNINLFKNAPIKRQKFFENNIIPDKYSNTEVKNLKQIQNMKNQNTSKNEQIKLKDKFLCNKTYNNIKSNFLLSDIINSEYNDNISQKKFYDINGETKRDKINKIMQCKSVSLSKDKKFVLKSSKKLNRASNKHTKKKLIELYSPINKIIDKEYSNLFNWIDKSSNINNQSSRLFNGGNTDEKSLELNSNINNKKNILFMKTFSFKKRNKNNIFIKRLLKLDNGNKIKNKKNYIEESYDKILNDSNKKNNHNNKIKALSFNKKQQNESYQNSGYKNDLDFREKRLKRLFSKYLKNISSIENKPKKKEIMNMKKDPIKLNIISNNEQDNNSSYFASQKVNFLLCSESTKKELGFEQPKIYVNNHNNILSYFYPNTRKQFFKFK